MNHDTSQFVPRMDQMSPGQEEERGFIHNGESKAACIEHEIIQGTVIATGYRDRPLQVMRLLFRILKGRLPEEHELEAFTRGEETDGNHTDGGRRLRPR